jgi:hypothetical protein
MVRHLHLDSSAAIQVLALARLITSTAVRLTKSLGRGSAYRQAPNIGAMTGRSGVNHVSTLAVGNAPRIWMNAPNALPLLLPKGRDRCGA